MKKTVTLKKNYEFSRVFNKGKFFAGRYIILYAMPNQSGNSRLGITASKKVGSSVKRNRIKRLIRESYLLLEEYVKDGYDLVFVARKFMADLSFWDVHREMKFLLKKLEVFDMEKWDC